MFPAGKNGISGHNEDGIEAAVQPDEFLSPSSTINLYKSFVRESLVNSARKTELQKFLIDLEQNVEIQSIYDTFGLMNDLESLENQYFQLRNKIDFEPHIEALINRISSHMNTTEEDSDQKVLKYLYTTTLTKLFEVKNRANHASIINLLDYMDVVQDHIMNLREINTKVIIDEYQNAYQNSLAIKIDRAAKYIEKQIIPEIKNIFLELDEYIIKLVEQTVMKKLRTGQAIKEAYDEKKKLKAAIQMRKVFIRVKLAGVVLGIISPIIRGVAYGASRIYELTINRKKDDANEEKDVPRTPQQYAELQQELQQRQLILLQQLDEVKDSMKNFGKDSGVQEVFDKIETYKKILQDNINAT